MKKSMQLMSVLLVLAATGMTADNRVLYEPGSVDALESIVPSDAQCRRTGEGITVQTGHEKPWPGVTIKAERGKWDLSPFNYLQMQVKNTCERRAVIHCRVDNPGANGVDHCLTDQATIEPGQMGIITVRFHSTPWVLSEPLELIGMRGYPQHQGKLDTGNVIGLVVFVNRPNEDYSFQIQKITTGGSVRILDSKTFYPFIDEYGQFIHADWPGKVKRSGDLQLHLKQEQKDLAEHPEPEEWNQYGGWAKGPKLKATGFFRVEKVQGKWWLVDPEGRLFWSHGIDCVGESNETPISDREHYFQWLPEENSPFASFYSRGSWAPHGYYQTHSPYRTFDFSRANFLRKYGKNWQGKFSVITHRRLRSWGMNTIGNWSQANIYLMQKTPYVGTIHFTARVLEGSTGYWGKFYDVFDPSFREGMQKAVQSQIERGIADPWCIGFFVHNELAWGDDTSLAIAALKSPADQPAKKVFIQDLKSKYGTIGKLNQVWDSSYSSWERMIDSTDEPDKMKAAEDLGAFYTKTAETYFATIREEFKKVSPKQLYLGCRFAWVNNRAAQAAAKYCDVVGYNRYAYTCADLKLPEDIDMPIIIGEFHFGALDRGMFHTGLKPTLDQEDRAQKYKDYVRSALGNPYIIGTHWFQYKDQETTGRGDGENYQIGFIDICDTPYRETINACREVGYTMYRNRLEMQ
ncbi:MAG: hypothetical protein JXA82_04430 [Sedimentisphaerales bacterium]|nr:hypothetical protein [Sedimentisphaerales bacterium]